MSVPPLGDGTDAPVPVIIDGKREMMFRCTAPNCPKAYRQATDLRTHVQLRHQPANPFDVTPIHITVAPSAPAMGGATASTSAAAPIAAPVQIASEAMEDMG